MRGNMSEDGVKGQDDDDEELTGEERSKIRNVATLQGNRKPTHRCWLAMRGLTGYLIGALHVVPAVWDVFTDSDCKYVKHTTVSGTENHATAWKGFVGGLHMQLRVKDRGLDDTKIMSHSGALLSVERKGV